MRSVWQNLVKLKAHIPYNSAIPLLDIHPRKTPKHISNEIWLRTFIAAFFVTGKILFYWPYIPLYAVLQVFVNSNYMQIYIYTYL
jgi:hypothetical protein